VPSGSPVRSPAVASTGGGSTAPFDVDTGVSRVGERTWEATVTDRWSIGRVPNGGYVLCTALAAVGQAVGQPHPLTVTAHYLSPATPGPAAIDVDVVKEGRSLSTATARLSQEGKARLILLATFGDLRAHRGPTLVAAVPPELPHPDRCPGRGPDTTPFPEPPSLVDRVEFRPAPVSAGWMAGQRDGPARIEGWLRLVDDPALDPARLVLLCDVMPPAVFAAMVTGWVPTLELTVHVRALPKPGWLRAVVSSRVIVDGLLEEECELWDGDDRLVAMSRQLARILPPPA